MDEDLFGATEPLPRQRGGQQPRRRSVGLVELDRRRPPLRERSGCLRPRKAERPAHPFGIQTHDLSGRNGTTERADHSG
jgi:hypothetical protein